MNTIALSRKLQKLRDILGDRLEKSGSSKYEWKRASRPEEITSRNVRVVDPPEGHRVWVAFRPGWSNDTVHSGSATTRRGVRKMNDNADKKIGSYTQIKEIRVINDQNQVVHRIVEPFTPPPPNWTDRFE